MQIKLGNSFMWFLPNGSVHLTDDAPGPVEVNFDALSQEEKNIIRIGIQAQQIFGTLPEEKEIKKEEVKPPTEAVKDIFERDNILAGKLQVILKQRIANIKLEIGKINDSRILGLLLTLEEDGKGRKSIIDLIKMKQENVYKDVLSSIKEVNAPANTEQLDPLARSLINDIVDVVEAEEVEVPLEK